MIFKKQYEAYDFLYEIHSTKQIIASIESESIFRILKDWINFRDTFVSLV